MRFLVYEVLSHTPCEVITMTILGSRYKCGVISILWTKTPSPGEVRRNLAVVLSLGFARAGPEASL